MNVLSKPVSDYWTNPDVSEEATQDFPAPDYCVWLQQIQQTCSIELRLHTCHSSES